MVFKPWHLFLLYPPHLTEIERERVMEKAGIGYTSAHYTEDEAKAAARDVLRKLKQVDGNEWRVCYAEPYTTRPRPEGINTNPACVPKCISTSDITT